MKRRKQKPEHLPKRTSLLVVDGLRGSLSRKLGQLRRSGA